MPTSDFRLLIFVVAYNAENYIGAVLDRIPRQIFSEYRCRILVIDDSSSDQTYLKALQFKEEHPTLDFVVLKHAKNRGYGGNQKAGYAYAIENGFDGVVLLHGDGQYAPEVMQDLIRPMAANHADAVLGSRMMVPGGALSGGMPLYKYVGNRVLTRIQNALLGMQLTEFHSGYRAYRINALAAVAFLECQDDFAFDSQIIIQLELSGHTFLEVPIPTFYGSEISHVNGTLYALKILWYSFLGLLHRLRLRQIALFGSGE